jgi:hypothetical protein
MNPSELDGPPDDDELTIKGEIETSSVPDLLRSLLASRETGILSFKNGEFEKTLFMKEGVIVFAGSTNPDERLGENLLLRGKITARQYLEASKLIRPGRRLGAILLELNALEPDELIPSVEEQIREVILELLGWTRGSYSVVMTEIDPDLVLFQFSIENLILEGIRRIRSWTSVARGIGNIEAVPVVTDQSDGAYKLELGEEEQQVLARVSGRSTIEQICQMSFLSNFETCRTLWALKILGFIKWGQAAELQREGEGVRAEEQELDLEDVVEKFNQMFNRIYVFLQGRLGGEVEVFMDGVMEEIARQYGALFDGVDLKQYGRADYEQMLANVADLPAEQRRALMVSGLSELVYVIQLAVQRGRGSEEEAVVSGIIKDGFKRLGAA